MGKSPNGYRGKMRNDCTAMMIELYARRQLRIEDFAADRGISASAVKRWLYSFRERIPMTISGGLAVVDESFDFSTLH
jgi:hypothetical protein